MGLGDSAPETGGGDGTVDDDAAVSRRRSLLISVGGAPQPIIRSIEYHRPERVVFFASVQSRETIDIEIRQPCGHSWAADELVVTPDAQSLLACLTVLRGGLDDALSRLGVTDTDLVVDFTGGTKPMVAALVLAMIRRPVTFSYVGGERRDRGGLGMVETGHEQFVPTVNPWLVLALDESREVGRLFDRGHFERARDLAQVTASRLDGSGERRFFRCLAEVAEGYHRWDLFRYGRAASLLPGAVNRLRRAAHDRGDADMMAWCDALDDDARRLAMCAEAATALRTGEYRRPPGGLMGDDPLIVDLLANARRRVDHGRYDDAVLRLYAAVEKAAKIALLSRGIDNSGAEVESLPEGARERLAHRADRRGRVSFGLVESFRLLAELGDPLGAALGEIGPGLGRTPVGSFLEARNHSMLAHGFEAVDGRRYDRIEATVRGILGVDPAAVAAFPPPCPLAGRL